MTKLSLEARVATVLPRATSVRLYHISTIPSRTDAIFSPGPHQAEEPTFCESHFLLITTPKVQDRDEIAIFGIEILVITTSSLTTVFVSKADSTGYASLLNIPSGYQSITRPVVEIFLDYLITPRLAQSPRVVLSLFARSQDQYLFPGSVENAEKHVLNDRQLIKWWCRVLDAVWRPHDADSPDRCISAHVIVPGTEKGEFKAFLPPGCRTNPAQLSRWSNDYPAKLIAVDDTLPPRCLIPRLPDDPKARFLDDLDGDHVGPDGSWRSVKSMDQFWELMSYRQECLAGRLVGFIWIVFLRPKELQRINDEAMESRTSLDAALLQDEASLPTSAESQQQNEHTTAHAPATEEPDPTRILPGVPPSGASDPLSTTETALQPPTQAPSQPKEQTIPIPMPITTTTVPLPSTTIPNLDVPPNPAPTPAPKPCTATKGQILTTTSTYSDLLSILLHLDFTGIESAAQSTRTWIDAVVEKSGGGVGSDITESNNRSSSGSSAIFGADVMGTLSLESEGSGTSGGGGKGDVIGNVNGERAAPVMMLTGVRKKKRKVDDDAHVVAADDDGDAVAANGSHDGSKDSDGTTTTTTTTMTPAPNVLSAGLVRKKPKIV